jgi:formylglycine-generating enzyme required for sulfatase activity
MLGLAVNGHKARRMADIFVSYTHTDRDRAERFAQRFRDSGFSVWWDDDINPRVSWDETIEREIDSAASVVVLWSPRSVASEWVRKEAHYAHDHKKLTPVMIETCQLPLAFTLTQTVDLSGWGGADDDRQWRKLLIWIADLKVGATEAPAARGQADRLRSVVGQFASGEAIVDGAFINQATPAGVLFRDHPEAPVMRILPAGDFLMGSTPLDPDHASVEAPETRITLGRSFAIGAYPVTNAQYRRHAAVAAAIAPAPPPKTGFSLFRRAPQAASPAPSAEADPEAVATQISFDEAASFAERLSQEAGARYRLPSEAEWEYACRAGSRTRYSWGEEIAPDRALYRWPGAAHAKASPPGQFAANAFGLFDMHGNVREWTQDSWRESYELTPHDGRPASEGHSSMRVTRGGGWSDPAAMLRSAARSRATQTIRSDVIGLRLVREL